MKLRGAKGLFHRNCKKKLYNMCFNAIYCSVGSFRWEGLQGLWQSLILALILINKPFILGFYCLPVKCNPKLGGKLWLFTGVFFSLLQRMWRLLSQRKKIVYLLLISGLRNETKLVKILHIWANETSQGRVFIANLTLSIKKPPWFCFRFLFLFYGTWYSW